MGKSWFGTIEGVKCYFPLFNAIFRYFFQVRLRDFGVNYVSPNSLQLTPPWKKLLSRMTRGIFRPLGRMGSGPTGQSYSVKCMLKIMHFTLHCSSGLSAPIPSSPKTKIFLGSCLTKATSMVWSIGGSLGSQN